MKTSNILLVIVGILLVVGSMWIGAYGQERLHGGYYEYAALYSGFLFFLIGVALAGIGIFREIG